MASMRGIREDLSGRSENSLFAQVVITLFVGVLALGAWAPAFFTAAVGTASCFLGLMLAGGLWLASGGAHQRKAAWDLAGAAVFLGFIAILISDAVPSL